MIDKTALAGLALAALAALALSACGGGSSSAGTSAAPGPAESSAAPSPSATSAAEVSDPCDVLDADAIEDLAGLDVKQGTSQAVSSSTVCTWQPTDATDDDAAVVSAQEGPLPGALSQVEGELKQQFDGSVSTITVSGADDARYITGKKSGLDIIDVLAQKDDVFFQVLIAAPRDVSKHKAGAVKVAEALIKA